jgi:hypothetical protein
VSELIEALEARRNTVADADWHDYTDSVEDVPTYTLLIDTAIAAERRRQAWEDLTADPMSYHLDMMLVKAQRAEDEALDALSRHLLGDATTAQDGDHDE